MNFAHDVDLRPFNTLALPARAKCFAKVETLDDLAHPLLQKSPRFILGGGSNVVLTGDIERTVLHMAILGKRLHREDADAWYVEACAGENWHDFVQWTLAQGWPGLENLSLIPGTVGAAPIQNIGAYGLEISDRLHTVLAWNFKNQASSSFTQADCLFGYRDSVFKQHGWHLNGDMAVTSVIFKLPKRWQANTQYTDVQAELAANNIAQPTPESVANAVMAVRQRKLPDPDQIPNAGSFFHNPIVDGAFADRLKAAHPSLPCYPQANGRVKLAAAWLIEQAGWKGRAIGPVGMYQKQALVLVNHGQAIGADVIATLQAVQGAVAQKFSIELQPEPVFLP